MRTVSSEVMRSSRHRLDGSSLGSGIASDSPFGDSFELRPATPPALLEDRQEPSGDRRGLGHGRVEQGSERVGRIGVADLHLTALDPRMRSCSMMSASWMTRGSSGDHSDTELRRR